MRTVHSLRSTVQSAGASLCHGRSSGVSPALCDDRYTEANVLSALTFGLEL